MIGEGRLAGPVGQGICQKSLHVNMPAIVPLARYIAEQVAFQGESTVRCANDDGTLRAFGVAALENQIRTIF